MKRSQALAVLVLALLMMASIPAQQAKAQTSYSEKLNVFIGGSNALWYFTFNGINGSAKLTSLENTPALTSYNITAIKTSGWSSDFQVFGPQGYNVFPVASLLQEGVLLLVGSDSFADASLAASAAGAYLFTSFVSYANATGSFEFYAPLTFNTIFPKTLLPLLPSGAGGFVSAITMSGFESTAAPFVIFEGTKSGSTFAHKIVVGSISGTALDANFRPSILSLYGSNPTSLQTSTHSSNSTIQVNVLDGIMSSKDKLAHTTNDTVRFTSSYSLANLPSGKKVTALNATVLQQQAHLQAFRIISRGVLRTGQKLTVTLSATNLSNSPLDNISFSDDWWKSTGSFTLLQGNDTLPVSIPEGPLAITPVYTLTYTGTGVGKLTIPASVISYTYKLGSSTFRGHTALNPIILSLGRDDAVIYSYVFESGGLGKSVGNTQILKVTAFNAGNQPAQSVVEAGTSIPGLAPNGSSTLTLTLGATGIKGTNATRLYVVTYNDEAGNSLQATCNIIPVIFSHQTMKLGLPALTISGSLSQFSKGSGTNLTLTFRTANGGLSNVTSFHSQIALPRGLACGTVRGNGTTCSDGVVSLSFAYLPLGKVIRSYMTFNVTKPENFIIGPSSFHGLTAGVASLGITNPLGIPTGVTLAKSFIPSQLFGGMIASVSVVVANGGPSTLYNATFGSSADTFDAVVAPTGVSKNVPTIAQGSNATLTYSVNATASSGQGALNSTAATVTFIFAGTQYTRSHSGPTVSIYQPLSAAITTTPSSVTEGKPFTLSISITNPSGVSVSNVLFTLPVPSGLALSQPQGLVMIGSNATVQAVSLGPHSILNATATAEASSGITVPFRKAQLTFTYGGVTIRGSVPSTQGIAIGENTTTRYLLPIGLVVLTLLAVAYYVRKLSQPNVPASQK